MGQGYLIDTNTVIDYLENKLPDTSLQIVDNIEFNLSVITRIELLAWHAGSSDQIKVLSDFIQTSTVFDLSENIILKSIEIRKIYRLKLPDAIIAATAMANDLSLLTRNIRDFGKVIELTAVNPHLM